MKRALVGILSLAVCTVGLAAVASADVPCPGDGGTGNLANVKIGLHARTMNLTKACTNGAPVAMGCDAPGNLSSLVTTWPVATQAQVYVIALDIPTGIGIKGVTFGLDYLAYGGGSGIYVNGGMTLCWDLQFPSGSPAFPGQPGSGVVVTSAACRGTIADGTDPQGEAISVLGFMDVTAYSAGPMAVTPRLYLANPDFQVADCVAASSNPCYPEFAGILGFGGPGYSPCVLIAVGTEETTWSRLKKGVNGE